jgi:hypothetical protein
MYTITTKNSGTDAYVQSGAESLRALRWMGYAPLALVAGLWTLL